MSFFTPKQQKVINECKYNSKWKTMINYGAVRSGKTFIDNFVFIFNLINAAKIAKRKKVLLPQFIVAGTSSRTIENNIMNSLYNTFGIKLPQDKHGNWYFRNVNLPTVKIVPAYDQSISGLRGIRGNTAYGAYINEAILANPRVFQEIIDRCSAPGARVICDTNPGSPNSFLLQYIKNSSPAIIANHFKFSDNKRNLDPKYYRSMLETTPSGAFFERSINGNFVANSGMIYKDYDKKLNQISPDKVPPLRDLDIFGGVDFGYNHYQSFTVLGESNDGHIYLLQEETRRLKTIDYWIQIAHRLQDKYGNIPFVCDTNDPEDIQNLRKAGINAIYADKHPGSVIAGIKLISKLIKSRKFKRVTNESVDSDNRSKNDSHQDNFSNEIYQYVWDENSQRDKPYKHHDHVLDSIRYPIYLKYENKLDQNDQPSMIEQEKDLQQLGLIN